MSRPFSPSFKQGVWIALYEYLIITTPISIYISLESLHKNDWSYFYKSPEWAIATIFLCFISLSKYISSIGKSGKRAVEPIVGVIGIFNLVLIIASTINANISIGTESNSAIYTRIILFFIATFLFFIFLTGSKLLGNSSE